MHLYFLFAYFGLKQIGMNYNFSDTAILPTPHGDFKITSFKGENSINEDHLLLVFGNVKNQESVITRIHSECLTGDVFGSKKCDCGPQLNESMRRIAENGSGVIVYLRQEGRGIGLFNKVNAYSLQDQGQDTIESNHSLGFDTDLRDFTPAVEGLKHLGVKSILLLSNNPEKVAVWEGSGIKINDRIPLITETNEHNEHYLRVKKEELNHML